MVEAGVAEVKHGIEVAALVFRMGQRELDKLGDVSAADLNTHPHAAARGELACEDECACLG